MKFANGTRVSSPGPTREEGGDLGPAEWTVIGPGPVRNGRRLYRLHPENGSARYLVEVLRSGRVPVRGRLNEDGQFVAPAQFLHVLDSQSGGRG